MIDKENVLLTSAYDRAPAEQKVLFVLFKTPAITKREMCNTIFYQDIEKIDYKNPEYKSKEAIIKTYLNRLQTDKKIIMDKSANPPVYELTHEAVLIVERLLNENEERLKREKEYYESQKKQQEEQKNHFIDSQLTRKNIKTFFQQQTIKAKVEQAIIKKKRFIEIDYLDIAGYCPEQALELINEPEKTYILMTDLLNELYSGPYEKPIKWHHPVIKNISGSDIFCSLKDIRTNHIDKLVKTEFEIESVTESRPTLINAVFECPSCGNRIEIKQNENTLRTPHICNMCSRRAGFKIVKKEQTDEIIVSGAQPLQDLVGGGFRSRTKFTLRGIFANTEYGRSLMPSGLFRASAIVKEEQILLKTGGKSTKTDYNFYITDIEPIDKFKINLEFSEEQIKNFHDLVKRPDYMSYFTEQIFHRQYGDDHIKTSLFLQLLAGSFENTRAMENLHILLVSDPGTGKTDNLLLRVKEIAPIGRYAEATKSSKAGLVGSVGQIDPHTGRRIFEQGVLSQANKGIIAIDEISSLKEDDPKVLNEAMASQTLTFNKQNIHMTIPCDVRILGAMNPPRGKFDNYTSLNNAIENINYSFIDRFGLIYSMRDIPNEKRDLAVAEKILYREQTKKTITDDFIKDFIKYARHNIKPNIRKTEADKIIKIYATTRQTIQNEQSHQIGTRFVNTISCLVLLFAKAHLRTETNNQDFEDSIFLLNKMMNSYGYPEIIIC